jgi:hypothetical protein
MKGDFTRITFDPRSHYSRVLMQQGRVQLDADFNELNAILLHRLETLANDLIGPHGGPAVWDWGANAYVAGGGFDIVPVDGEKRSFAIRPGRYYVDGVLCEQDAHDPTGNLLDLPYDQQPNYPLLEDDPLVNANSAINFLVYLDVWERHLTYQEMEDDQGAVISIRESALFGPDTATRAQVVWQVRVEKTDRDRDEILRGWQDWVTTRQPEQRGWLKARARRPEGPGLDSPCITPPEASYRGAENQLYRVEIHRGGNAQTATFKWSRENGSVIFPVETASGNVVTLKTLGRDPRFGLHPHDWVEIVDDAYTLNNLAEPLIQVESVDYDANRVTLKNALPAALQGASDRHPILRRWDQCESERVRPNENGITLKEGNGESDWFELEDGVQVQFQKVDGTKYRSGDYWVIPARTATGDVEWPGVALNPQPLPPRGIQHHYAPLRLIAVAADGVVNQGEDMRRHFQPNLIV